MNIYENYIRWTKKAMSDIDLAEELRGMENNYAAIEDAFYKELEFGTGGLRGIIGAGTNRMNVYTVARASQGLANYVLKSGGTRIAVSYDSRIKSELFSKVASGVFAANGIEVFIYPELMPTPALSFAVRYLNCAAGIMITASHNPACYNGYKVYNSKGCQITTNAAAEIFAEIGKLDFFDDVKTADFDECIKNKTVKYISDDCYTAFIDEVKKQSVLFDEEPNKNFDIVYSPLNGTGLGPVTRILSETGFDNVFAVPEQKAGDGNFPTCPYPNPEIKEALDLGLKYASERNAELMLATDPDADRVGIAVKDKNGEFVLLTGNNVGVLLLDFICSQRLKHGKMPANPVMLKTIVTTDMAEHIAEKYGVKTINVLTGFKFIGEQIGFLEENNEVDRYIFGFEESYGYLSGTYVRDKDAINGVFLICEMFACYKTQGIGLAEKLEELYKEFGYSLNTLYSYEFAGLAGFEKMKKIMRSFRSEIKEIGSKKVCEVLDYATGIDGLPKSDVIKFILEGNSSVVVRPSGTEAKIKVYVCVTENIKEAANKTEQKILSDIVKYFDI